MEFGGYTFVYLIPILAAIGLVEGVFYARFRQQPFPWGESAASIGVGVGQAIKKGLTRGLVFGAVIWLYQFRLFTVPLDTWWGWVLLFFGTEFVYYWHHRWGHEIRWLWATHSVHHSGNHLTFLAAIRLGWTGEVSGAILMFAPLVLLGFDPLTMFAVLAVNLLYQFWIHSEFIPKLGWFDLVFNSPSNHRVHHASNPIYLDKNYGGVIVLFDHVFGTYQPELASEPCRYGLVHPLTSNNPLLIAFNEWIAMGRDVIRSRSARDRFMRMFSARPAGAPTAGARARPTCSARHEPQETPVKTILLAMALIATASLAAAQQIPPDLERACRADYRRLCSGVLPGGGRILQCLRDKAAQVSDPCKAALTKAEQDGTIPAR